MEPARRRSFEIHPDAEAELAAAALYYDERRAFLGDDYLREMQRLIDFALAHPDAGAPVEGGARWVLSRRFPYAVVYKWSAQRLQVVAFAHMRRRPGYWHARDME